MKPILFILIILITCGSLVLIVFRFLKKQNSCEVLKLNTELRKQRQEFFLPSRLDAYQRSVLLMERIHPNSLIMRTHNPGLNAKLYQAELAKSVRTEFEHNVTQQIFITPVTWGIMKSSVSPPTQIQMSRRSRKPTGKWHSSGIPTKSN